MSTAYSQYSDEVRLSPMLTSSSSPGKVCLALPTALSMSIADFFRTDLPQPLSKRTDNFTPPTNIFCLRNMALHLTSDNSFGNWNVVLTCASLL